MLSSPVSTHRVDGTSRPMIAPEALGCPQFRRDYGIKYAYLAGAMFKGIASTRLVVAMGRAGLMGYFGTGGLDLAEIESAIRSIQSDLRPDEAYGMNLLCRLDRPELEERMVDLYLRYGVRCIEASAFINIRPSLVLFRLKGIHSTPDGQLAPRRILAKVSRPEVAEAFLRPAPESILRQLVERGRLTAAEAELGSRIPVAEDICVEADSAGHTDQRVALTLLPAMFALRDRIRSTERYAAGIRVGAAGGIGSPHAAAAAFIMGADFILTGSINQCTVEAGTSDAVKDLLQDLNVQDTTYAPAGDMFETGARVQVVKKGLLFAARANKLYELYLRHNSLDEIDEKNKAQIQERFFNRSFADAWAETKVHWADVDAAKIAEIERNPKQKMALVFRWYFVHSVRLALGGIQDQRVDYQIHCGPAMGAFNQWVKGTDLEPWRNRRVAVIAERLMHATAVMLSDRFAHFTAGASPWIEDAELAASPRL